MEFGSKEILILVGIVVIFGILLHGFRSVRHSRNGTIKVSRRKQSIFDDDGFDDLPGELLTGEVRVTKRDENSAEEVSDTIRRTWRHNTGRQTSAYRERNEPSNNVIPLRGGENRQPVREPPRPVETPPPAVHPEHQEREEPTFHAEPVIDSADEVDDYDNVLISDDGIQVSLNEFEIDDDYESDVEESVEAVAAAPQPEPTPQPSRAPLVATRDDEEEDLPPAREPQSHHADRESASSRRKPFWEDAPARPEPTPPPRTEPQPQRRSKGGGDQTEVIVLHVMGKSGAMIPGSDLLESLLANGMRYGAMQIFHRHQNVDGSGAVLFSLANSVKPGFFDLAAMDAFETPGVSMFMALEDLDNPLDAYKELVKTAQNLAKALNASVLDETRSVLTKQTIEHYRQQIIEYTRRSFTLTH